MYICRARAGRWLGWDGGSLFWLSVLLSFLGLLRGLSVLYSGELYWIVVFILHGYTKEYLA